MRYYEATIVIKDKFSDSKVPDEAKEFSLGQLKELVEFEQLMNNGLEITQVNNLRKIHD
jgi:hypothetical protein